MVLASKPESKTSLSALNLEGQLHLFLLIPKYLEEHYGQLCAHMEDVPPAAAWLPISVPFTYHRIVAPS